MNAAPSLPSRFTPADEQSATFEALIGLPIPLDCPRCDGAVCRIRRARSWFTITSEHEPDCAKGTRLDTASAGRRARRLARLERTSKGRTS